MEFLSIVLSKVETASGDFYSEDRTIKLPNMNEGSKLEHELLFELHYVLNPRAEN